MLFLPWRSMGKGAVLFFVGLAVLRLIFLVVSYEHSTRPARPTVPTLALMHCKDGTTTYGPCLSGYAP